LSYTKEALAADLFDGEISDIDDSEYFGLNSPLSQPPNRFYDSDDDMSIDAPPIIYSPETAFMRRLTGEQRQKIVILPKHLSVRI
jgi:hypothetical protein